jgi:hypothetical protein
LRPGKRQAASGVFEALMSWDDWDDDEPRPRPRGSYDDLELRHGSPPQSGAVTGAGVVTIIMGVLFLLCGVTSGFCGVVFAGVGQMAREQGNVLPPGMFEVTGGVLLGQALLYLILGVGNLIAGIVTLQRRNGGRIFTLILGAVSGLLGLGHLSLIVMILSHGVGLFGAMGSEELAVQSVMMGIIALVFVGHTIFVYTVLLNSHNKEEFD